MAENNGNGSFWAGFLAGAIGGAIVTILYAPKTGEETRSELKGRQKQILGRANHSMDDAYKLAETAAAEARDRFGTLASALRRRSEDFLRRGQVILEEQINNSKNAGDADGAELHEILMTETEPEAAVPEPEEIPVPGDEALPEEIPLPETEPETEAEAAE